MDKNSLERFISPLASTNRKREKARERQRKRRQARKEQIEKQRGQKDSSDENEEFSLQFLQQTDQERTPAPVGEGQGAHGEGNHPQEQETRSDRPARRQLQLGDAAAHSKEDVLTTTVEEANGGSDTTRRSSGGESEHIIAEISSQEDEDDLKKLAEAFAMVKCTSFVSDAAIEKLFTMFIDNGPLIQTLLNSGRISKSYLNTVKPTCLQDVPNILSAIYAHKVDDNGILQTVYERDLTALPVEAVNRKPPYKKVMWFDSYVNLKEIVDLHITIHLKKGFSAEEVHNTLKKCSLSIDGVVEARKGPRRFVVTSIKIHNCIYLWRIVTPLIGDADAKLNAEDLCRYVTVRDIIKTHYVMKVFTFSWIVQQINGERRVTLQKIVADMPERHDMKNMVGHQGFHACEYCRLKGVTAGKGGVFWPYPQCVPAEGDLRTHDQMKDMAR